MIDTHCHIDEEDYRDDLAEVVLRQQQAGVEAMVVPGVNLASVETVMDVCGRYPGYMYPALGLHPEDVKADWAEVMDRIEEAIRRYRSSLCAIGEIGLDYHWDVTYKQEQHEVLRRQLRLAAELDLPVILHNRESTEDIVRILREQMQERPIRGVFHCFNGSREVAKQLLGMGFYLGIGGVLTFKNCKLSEHLDVVPLNRLLLETDAPYMAPVPHRGERNESRWMAHVVDRLAEVYQVTPEEVIFTTSASAKSLFGIK